MRIAFINNFYNNGGSSIVSYELAKIFSKDHEMMFIGSVDGPFREKFSKLGQTLLWSSNNFDYDKEINEKIGLFNPEITHVFIPGAQNPSYFNSLPGKKKFVTILCGQNVGFDTSLFNKVFFMSEYQSKINQHIKNYEVVRCGKQTDGKIKTQSANPTFGRVSSYCPSKMIQDTILCASTLRTNNFIVAGEILDNQYINSLRAYANHLDLKNLLMESNINNNRKNEIMSSIDVYHYPSSNEAFCFSLLEAFANGLPAISYKNSAIPELFESDEWLCNDFEELIEKTKIMSEKSAKDRQEIGSKNFQIYKKYSSEIYAQTIFNSYSE